MKLTTITFCLILIQLKVDRLYGETASLEDILVEEAEGRRSKASTKHKKIRDASAIFDSFRDSAKDTLEGSSQRPDDPLSKLVQVNNARDLVVDDFEVFSTLGTQRRQSAHNHRPKTDSNNGNTKESNGTTGNDDLKDAQMPSKRPRNHSNKQKPNPGRSTDDQGYSDKHSEHDYILQNSQNDYILQNSQNAHKPPQYLPNYPRDLKGSSEDSDDLKNFPPHHKRPRYPTNELRPKFDFGSNYPGALTIDLDEDDEHIDDSDDEYDVFKGPHTYLHDLWQNYLSGNIQSFNSKNNNGYRSGNRHPLAPVEDEDENEGDSRLLDELDTLYSETYPYTPLENRPQAVYPVGENPEFIDGPGSIRFPVNIQIGAVIYSSKVPEYSITGGESDMPKHVHNSKRGTAFGTKGPNSSLKRSRTHLFDGTDPDNSELDTLRALSRKRNHGTPLFRDLLSPSQKGTDGNSEPLNKADTPQDAGAIALRGGPPRPLEKPTVLPALIETSTQETFLTQ